MNYSRFIWRFIVNKVSYHSVLVWISILFFQGCATPMAPTGGELPRTGPIIVQTIPNSGTTNFDGNEIRIVFEDWVDRASFARAFGVEPGINISYDISWRRKTAIIKLNDPLPDSTTVLFTLNNELRDTRSNRISSPLRIAVSTGDQIDSERITFRIYPTSTGQNISESSILLYRDPFDLESPALYTSSADTSGIVRFDFLAKGDYKAILVHDINRNRTWDRSREFAQPYLVHSFNISEIDTSTFLPFYYARRDTSRPVIQGLGLLTQNRLRVRFNKDIPHAAENLLVLSDSLNNEISAFHLHNDLRESVVSFFQTESSLSENVTYTISKHTITDRSGNRLFVDDLTIDGSSDPDTVRLRYISVPGELNLTGNVPISIRYNKFIDDASIVDSVKVFMNRGIANEQFDISTERNRLVIRPKSVWNPANTYEIKVWDPPFGVYRDIRPKVIGESDLGGIIIQIQDSTMIDLPLRVNIIDSRGNSIVNTSFKNEYRNENLLVGSYHVIIFEDRNQNGNWDFGSIDPFREPAWIYVDRRFPVRSRMTSELNL